MTTGRTDQERRTDWLWLIRRSIGLPDIMSERGARAVIEGRIASTFDKGIVPSESALNMAADLLDAILDLGARGDLDDCLVEDEAMILDLREVGIGVPDVGSRVIGQATDTVSGSADTMHRAGAAAKSILVAITDYVITQTSTPHAAGGSPAAPHP
jgi:hypothetical protein